MYYQYEYDHVGNNAKEITAAATTDYTYDSANHLTQASSQAYTWDTSGNLTSDGVRTYAYNTANRLTGVTQGTDVTTFLYNGLGDRVAQTANSQTTQYTLDMNAGLTQVLDDGTNSYLYGNDRIAQVGAADTQYFLGDALDSVRQMTDGAGVVGLTKDYAPYGSVKASTGTASSPYGYTGEMADSTGLVYLRARYYAASLGRFTSRDAWQGDYNRPGTLNRWAYVHGNPINFTDPFGLWSLAPGLELSDGGLYDKGQLTMNGSPAPCQGACWQAASTTMSIFVPQRIGNQTYNDVMYMSPTSYQYYDPFLKATSDSPSAFATRLIKTYMTYDAVERSRLKCRLNEILIPTNTNAWENIGTIMGESSPSFSSGGFTDFSIGFAIGSGFDQGFLPASASMADSAYPNEMDSIASRYQASQSEQERQQSMSFFKTWDDSWIDRNSVNAIFSAGAVGVQGYKGVTAFRTREYQVVFQEHVKIPRLYRSILITNRSFQDISTQKYISFLNYLSFENGSWHEENFDRRISR